MSARATLQNLFRKLLLESGFNEGALQELGPSLDAVATTSQVGIESEEYTVLPGQDAFVLPSSPRGALILSVNGHAQRPNVDFTVVEQTVHWISNDFPLSFGDTVQITYLTSY